MTAEQVKKISALTEGTRAGRLTETTVKLLWESIDAGPVNCKDDNHRGIPQ